MIFPPLKWTLYSYLLLYLYIKISRFERTNPPHLAQRDVAFSAL
jgi:hypothetical protein